MNTDPELSPGNPDQCKGNGEHFTESGQPIEICCDECDYQVLCFDKYGQKRGQQP